jgi:hypothetical protein
MPESKRGRPPIRVGDTTTPVTVRVPSKDYDRVCERATRERVKPVELIRRSLSRLLEDEDDG